MFVPIPGPYHRDTRLRQPICTSGVRWAEDPEPEWQGEAGWGQREGLPEGILWRGEMNLSLMIKKKENSYSTRVSKIQALCKLPVDLGLKLWVTSKTQTKWFTS